MKESVTTRKILKWLNKIPNCWAVKLHGSAYSQAGMPDILCIVYGDAWLFEVKTEIGKLSPIQVVMHKRIRQAYGRVCVVRHKEDVVDCFSSLPWWWAKYENL